MTNTSGPSSRRALLMAAPIIGAGLSLHLSTRAGAAEPAGRAAFPERTIVIVDGFPPGGGSDIVARQLGHEMERRWSRPVVVENRSGANGTIAAIGVSRAAPDGHTLLMAHISTVVLAPLVLPGTEAAAIANFLPVSLVAAQPHVVVVDRRSPIRSMAELMETARSRRHGRLLTYGSTGAGSIQHLAAASFAAAAGIEMQHVPYRGSAPALSDLMAGTIDLIFEGITPASPFIRAGQLRPLAVTTLGRSPAVEVPTLAEIGFPGFEMTSWWAIAAPKGLAAERRDAIADAVQDALSAPAFASFADGLGVLRGHGIRGERLERFFRDEAMKYAALIERLQVRAE